nr:MAG TPA: hypothetical protein [Caudoviricetes sp.]
MIKHAFLWKISYFSFLNIINYLKFLCDFYKATNYIEYC